MKVYYGASLFTEKDLSYNAQLAKEIRKACPGIELYVPQENASINDKTKSADSIMIFDGDTQRLQESDVLFCFLDEDLGLATEIGYFAALCKADSARRIIGIYSDMRDGSIPHSFEKEKLMQKKIAESQFSYINLYLVGAVKKYGQLYHTSKEAIQALKEFYESEKKPSSY